MEWSILNSVGVVLESVGMLVSVGMVLESVGTLVEASGLGVGFGVVISIVDDVVLLVRVGFVVMSIVEAIVGLIVELIVDEDLVEVFRVVLGDLLLLVLLVVLTLLVDLMVLVDGLRVELGVVFKALVVLVDRAVFLVLVDDLELTDFTAVELVLADFLEDALVLARRVESPSIDLFLSIVYNYIMAKLKITKKQQAVLNFLEDFTEENGYSPSYREIQTGLGMSAVSAVAEHIDNMVSKGILKKVPGAARSLEVLDFRHTETVELFRTRLVECSEEERKVLLAAADVLGLDLGE